jgi:hypothetical protein
MILLCRNQLNEKPQWFNYQLNRLYRNSNCILLTYELEGEIQLN